MFWSHPYCGKGDITPVIATVLVSCTRIPAMVCTGFTQRAMAAMILYTEAEAAVTDAAAVRQERRVCMTYSVLR